MGQAEPLYITTPIYYVNDAPHIGHGYTSILADTAARYRRLFGGETYMLTGTDEHGQKVQQAADKRGIGPLEHCDDLHQAFKQLLPEIHVDNQDFIRTTEDRHIKVVKELLTRLHDKGDIYAQDYEGWYSTSVERFWTEKDLVDGRCPESGGEVRKIKERNYFFRMSKYGDALKAHIENNPDFLRPAFRRNEVLGFLEKGLQDLCISRPKKRLAWGIELPFDTDYVTYVWFDALLNYASAIGYVFDTERFDTWWPVANHLIGKDILTTHSVYWTTMLMALGLPLPQSIIAHGWWLSEDRKMGKSEGNAIDPIDFRATYGSDVIRYVLLREMVIGLDASFSEAMVVRRNNSDLANDLGNLARRAAGLIDRYFEGKIPDPGAPTPAEEEIAAAADGLKTAVPGLVADLKLHSAIEETMQFVRQLNKYMTDTAPYKSVKTDPQAAARSLYTVLEGLRHAAWFLSPIMPMKTRELLEGLGTSPEVTVLSDLSWGGLTPGVAIHMKKGLFPRREAPKTEVEVVAPPKPKKKSKASKEAPAADGTIPFDTFAQVDLRVATVLEAAPVAGSDRLLAVQIDLGDEKRQVVAGIAEHVKPEELVGTQVVVVYNLAPRKIFKQVSQGMILAVDTPDGGLTVVRPSTPVAPGTQVR